MKQLRRWLNGLKLRTASPPLVTVSEPGGKTAGGNAKKLSDSADAACFFHDSTVEQAAQQQYLADLKAIERIELEREGEQECFFRAMAERAQRRAR